MSTWRKEGRVFESVKEKKQRMAKLRADRKINKEMAKKTEAELSLQR